MEQSHFGGVDVLALALNLFDVSTQLTWSSVIRLQFIAFSMDYYLNRCDM